MKDKEFSEYFICIDPGPERSGGILFGLEEGQDVTKPTTLWTSTGSVPDDSKKKGTKVVHNRDNNHIMEDIVKVIIDDDPKYDEKRMTLLMEIPESRGSFIRQSTLDTSYWAGRLTERFYHGLRAVKLLHAASISDYSMTPSTIRLIIAGKRNADAKEVKEVVKMFFGDELYSSFHAHVFSAARLYVANRIGFDLWRFPGNHVPVKKGGKRG